MHPGVKGTRLSQCAALHPEGGMTFEHLHRHGRSRLPLMASVPARGLAVRDRGPEAVAKSASHTAFQWGDSAPVL